MKKNIQTDKNFDDIADHFLKKIYNTAKGKIRIAVLWRDIAEYLETLPNNTSLKVLDIGGGFGQISQALAQQGHHVTVNDISITMLEKAKEQVAEANIANINFIHAPYQDLPTLVTEKYDLILCHAVLEWLAEPEVCVTTISNLLTENGMLSLCFYNPVSKIYRNLIMGNFYNLDKLANNSFQSNKKSLTPNNPCEIATVQSWLESEKLSICKESGVRVFSDYVLQKRGGNENLEAVIQKELEYSDQSPYKNMGRYYHILARKSFTKN